MIIWPTISATFEVISAITKHAEFHGLKPFLKKKSREAGNYEIMTQCSKFQWF